MEVVNILGVDPSLRNTGMCILTYNTETKDIRAHHCQTLVNPHKYTGKDAILNMLEMIQETVEKNHEYFDCDTVIVESPATMFNKAWSQVTISMIAHVAGGAAALLGVQKVHFFRPSEWNKTRKKEVTHNNTVAILGNPDDWHYTTRLKSEKTLEHVLDAASMALFWIKNTYAEE